MKAKLSAEMVVAARKGDWQRVDSLLQRRANVNATGAHSVSPLMLAAQKGQADACASLIERRAALDAHDSSDRSTALMHACRVPPGHASESVVHTLLTSAASVDLRDRRGHTALLVAAEAGNSGAALLLLEHGADAEAVAHPAGVSTTDVVLKDQVVNTFLHRSTGNPVDGYVKYRRKCDEQELKDILTDNLDEDSQEPWATMSEGVSPTRFFGSLTIHTVSEVPSPVTSPVGITKADLDPDDSRDSDDSEYHVDLDEPEWFNGKWFSRVAPLRPRDMAKPPPDAETLKVLQSQAEIMRGVVPKPKGTGDTALTIAARGGHADLCELLLQYSTAGGALVPGRDGETALCVAARMGHVEACRVLLSSRPTPAVHKDALRIAEAHAQEATAGILRGYGERMR